MGENVTTTSPIHKIRKRWNHSEIQSNRFMRYTFGIISYVNRLGDWNKIVLVKKKNKITTTSRRRVSLMNVREFLDLLLTRTRRVYYCNIYVSMVHRLARYSLDRLFSSSRYYSSQWNFFTNTENYNIIQFRDLKKWSPTIVPSFEKANKKIHLGVGIFVLINNIFKYNECVKTKNVYQ